MDILHKSVHFCAECPLSEKMVYDVRMLPKSNIKTITKGDAITHVDINLFCFAPLVTNISISGANKAQPFTNGRILMPIRTLMRVSKTQSPVKVAMNSRPRR
jgi:hypothetical protein